MVNFVSLGRRAVAHFIFGLNGISRSLQPITFFIAQNNLKIKKQRGRCALFSPHPFSLFPFLKNNTFVLFSTLLCNKMTSMLTHYGIEILLW
jgi:hypothetical protein